MGHVTRVRVEDETFHIYPEHLEITVVKSPTLEHDTKSYPSRHLFNEATRLIINSGEVL